MKPSREDRIRVAKVKRMLLGEAAFKAGDRVYVKWMGFPHQGRVPRFGTYVIASGPHRVRGYESIYEGKNYFVLQQHDATDWSPDHLLAFALESAMELADDEDGK